MDDFGLDRQELNGTLITMEFGPGGRIQQLWASDPAAPEDSEEFQFVAPPLIMGEETTEDYFPGTILLGARNHPDAPWIVSRNSRAEVTEEDEESPVITFDYEFAFLDEIRATGKFYEIQGQVPQIAWDIELTNKSRRSMEIGELGFPLALNNVLEGFSSTDRGIRELWNDRVYVHKNIGGAASYLYAQRLTGRPPGLLIFPGGDTRWEFFNHVPASLNTPHRWEGTPVVYVHSQAAIEREGWQEWFSGHTSIVLEPGEVRSYQMRFASVDRHIPDGLHGTLIACGRPALKVFPAAVAPAEVGIALEVAGATPTQFFTDAKLELETDADEEGGFCFIKPKSAGPIKVSFDDTLDRNSEAHVLFIEPIETLIQHRARWIMRHQVSNEAGVFFRAILPAENSSKTTISDPEAFSGPFGIESSLADALFLAEKNTIYPDDGQIALLDDYLEEFVEDDLQNPGDYSVGSVLPDMHSVAANFGRPQVYPLVFNLFHSMARVAKSFGHTAYQQQDYLKHAAKTVVAMFNHANEALMDSSGIPLMSYLPDLIKDLYDAGMKAEGDSLTRLRDRRDVELGRRRYPFFTDGQWGTSAFEEVFSIARRRGNEDVEERALRCSNAARSQSVAWWWYGSDKRWLSDGDGYNPAVFDKGELCLGSTTVANALMFFKTLERDYATIHEPSMRLAFGGMLGIWALVQKDGSASMAFCPDAASKQFGHSDSSGDVGIGLFHYLRGIASYVLPSRSSGVATFGCHFEAETEEGSETFAIRPWDGVGRRVIVRQFGLEVLSEVGQITEVRVDSRKRNAQISLKNTSKTDLMASFRVKGMWGSRFEVAGKELQGENGEVKVTVALPAAATIRVDLVVKR